MGASEKGYLDIVRFLLPKIDTVDENGQVAWAVIDIAAARGYLDILEFAADNADNGYVGEPRDDKSDALLCAINGGQSAAAMFLVTRYYREWCLREGLEEATKKGMDAVADCIYGVLFDEGYRTAFSDFFVHLAGDGFINAIVYLSDRGHNGPELVGLAFVNAARMGDIDVLKTLLKTESVSRDSIDEAFYIAARSRRDNAIVFLYSNSDISTQAINTAFENAGSVAISKFLYKKLVNPVESTIAAFCNAACCGCHYTCMSGGGRIAILKFLCSTGLVPDKRIREAFIEVIGKWYAGIVTMALRNESGISCEVTLEAFQKAVSTGSTDVVKLLITNPCISLPIKEEAMVSAAREGRYEVLKEICMSEDWSVDALNIALSSTSDAVVLSMLRAKKATKQQFSKVTFAES